MRRFPGVGSVVDRALWCLRGTAPVLKSAVSVARGLLLVLCGTLAGTEGVVEIRRWGQTPQDFPRRMLPFKSGSKPRHPEDVLNAIGGTLLAQRFADWTESLRGQGRQDHRHPAPARTPRHGRSPRHPRPLRRRLARGQRQPGQPARRNPALSRRPGRRPPRPVRGNRRRPGRIEVRRHEVSQARVPSPWSKPKSNATARPASNGKARIRPRRTDAARKRPAQPCAGLRNSAISWSMMRLARCQPHPISDTDVRIASRFGRR